jgi:hypothetical protein
MADGARDPIRMQGWIEVIVRDKEGRIKHYIGPRSAEEVAKELGSDIAKDEDCALASLISPAMPSKFLDYYWRKNIVTNVGLAEVIRLVFSGLTGTKFGYLAIGTGTTAEAATDTELGHEIARKSATVTQTTTTITNDTAKLEATFSKDDGLTGTSNVSESGIFNASTGGVLLARKTFSAVPLNWDAGDMITIRYFIQMGR